MSFLPTDPLYLALACYAVGTLAALTSLFSRDVRLQRAGLVLMIAGFVAHTIWIGTICTRTGHPPITNLPEATSFIAWTVFAVELALWIRYRVYAAVFFVYPLVLLLLTISAAVGEHFAVLDPQLRSNVFMAHLLLTTVGVAGLLIGVAFGLLAFIQDRSLKSKQRGRLWDWIPSLGVCKTLGYRALAIGFSIYTLGILCGVLWSYRTNAELMDLRVKQVGALIAWILFGVLLQQYISGAYRARRTVLLSAGGVVAILVAIVGIRG
ncbi:MAG: cytochrome c biogenesis protein CcsA [Acidobacteria bacterium]|nr:cytochrome c biogenesis protein CcsA [Acidobacteriota bacterium]MBV9475755.1 cytochrome c biogenesis protein CcsA [Acidobacteriota bacterium]